jgi:alpha/beta superfamily hydrolase
MWRSSVPEVCLPDIVVEHVSFPAGPFRLEGELAYPDGGMPTGAAVLAGPHPLLGGTRHNNVVRALGDALAGRGLATLRFDYRGAGGSEGPVVDLPRHLAEFWQTSHVSGEEYLADDLRGAVGFLRAVVGPEAPLALVGYSFGCSLLPRVADSAAALVLIAPTVGKHDLAGFEALTQPKLVIAPHDDFAADEDAVEAWFARLSEPRELLRPWLDGHFFRGHERRLAEVVGSFLDRHGRHEP